LDFQINKQKVIIMADISLTDFVDFVAKSGTPKFSKVKEINRREDYQPAFDFWKKLRDGLVEFHKSEKNKKELDKIADNLTDTKKVNRYKELIKCYKSFLGRKKIQWFDPPKKKWTYESLNVRLNPELGLEINGELYVIKLWFKASKLSQAKVDFILLLLNEKMKTKKLEEVNFAVLDIGQKKLYSKTKLTSVEFALLEAEALSYIRIWDSLQT